MAANTNAHWFILSAICNRGRLSNGQKYIFKLLHRLNAKDNVQKFRGRKSTMATTATTTRTMEMENMFANFPIYSSNFKREHCARDSYGSTVLLPYLLRKCSIYLTVNRTKISSNEISAEIILLNREQYLLFIELQAYRSILVHVVWANSKYKNTFNKFPDFMRKWTQLK